MNPVLESVQRIIPKCRDVKLNSDRLKEVCSGFDSSKIRQWTDCVPFKYNRLTDVEEVGFVFVLDALNFCYWGDPKWTIEYQGKEFDGSWGMIASIRRAFDEGSPITDAAYLSGISERDLTHILRGNCPIPLFEERVRCLHELGRVVKEKYQGDFTRIVRAADGDALKLLDIITADFPLFDDFAPFDGRPVFFHKRAQLVAGDLWRVFNSQGFGKFHNLDELTACADYKAPQGLRKLGVIEYSPALADKVDNLVPLVSGSPEEVQIRAFTIWAIELMKRELKPKIPGVRAMDIDSYLWLAGQTKSPSDKPYHRTRTIFY